MGNIEVKTARKKPSDLTQRLHHYLTDLIESGGLQVGDQLPSRTQLGRELEAQPSAISFALKRVSQSIPLTFEPGRGVYLANNDKTPKTMRLGLIGGFASSFAEAMNDPIGRHYHIPLFQGIFAMAEEQRVAVMAVPNTAVEPIDVEKVAALKPNCLLAQKIELRDTTVAAFRRKGIPLLMGSAGDGHLPRIGVSYVDFDHAAAIRQTVDMLVERGHRRIAFFLSQGPCGAWKKRRDAFYLAMVQRTGKVRREYVRIHQSLEPPYKRQFMAFRTDLEAVLDLPEPPTAILCIESVFIAEMVDMVRDRGMRPGKDISLIGAMTVGLADQVPISVWSYDLAEMGRQLIYAAEKLAADPHTVLHVNVPWKFVDKGTLMQPARA